MEVVECGVAIESTKEKEDREEKQGEAEMESEEEWMLNIREGAVDRGVIRLDAIITSAAEDRTEDKEAVNEGTIIIITSKAPNETTQMTSRKKRSALITK